MQTKRNIMILKKNYGTLTSLTRCTMKIGRGGDLNKPTGEKSFDRIPFFGLLNLKAIMTISLKPFFLFLFFPWLSPSPWSSGYDFLRKVHKNDGIFDGFTKPSFFYFFILDNLHYFLRPFFLNIFSWRR